MDQLVGASGTVVELSLPTWVKKERSPAREEADA